MLAHFLFEALGYLAALALYLRERRKDFLASPMRSSIVVAAILGGAAGSRLLAWLEDPAVLAQRWNDAAFLLGSKTIIGGLLGGTAAVEIAKSRIGITRRTGDIFAIPLAIGIAIGRIGCYFGGLEDGTYGIATTLPWGLDLGDGIMRHPVQLYETAFLLLLAAFMATIRPRLHREGNLYRVFLISYLAWRLGIDFLKPEPSFGGLSMIQWSCVIALAIYARDLVAQVRQPAHG